MSRPLLAARTRRGILPVLLSVACLVAGAAQSTRSDGEDAPSETTVVGLGDSVVAGSGCSCPGFVSIVAAARSDRRRVSTGLDLGRNGMTAHDLAAALQRDPVLRRAVARADVVLLTVGANDLVPALQRWQSGGCRPSCPVPELASVGGDVARVMQQVRGLGAARVFVSGYWNVFPEGRVATARFGPDFAGWSDQLTRRFNSAVQAVAERAGATYVDVYGPFKGADGRTDDDPLLAADGDHPDARGHDVLARSFLAAGAAG